MALLSKVVSGGQTGVDQIGLEVARSLNIVTGGYAPKGFLTERGACPQLSIMYDLKETDSTSYELRTELNVQDSDGTVLFGNMMSSGSYKTIKFCKKHEKPYFCNPTAEELRDWIFKNEIQVLNVAGNRGSKLSTAAVKKIKSTLLFGFLQILSYNKTQLLFSPLF